MWGDGQSQGLGAQDGQLGCCAYRRLPERQHSLSRRGPGRGTDRIFPSKVEEGWEREKGEQDQIWGEEIGEKPRSPRE